MHSSVYTLLWTQGSLSVSQINWAKNAIRQSVWGFGREIMYPHSPHVCCCCCSVTLCDLMISSTLSFPVLQCLSPGLAQTQSTELVMPSNHRILCCPSPFASNLSQHQGLFQWVSSLHQVQSIVVSASVSVLPMNIQGRFPSELTGLIFLLPKGLSEVFSNTTVRNHEFFSTQPSNSHIYTQLLVALTTHTFVGKVRSLLFNMPSRFVLPFLPRSKHLLISWLESPSTVILEPKKRKPVTVSIVPHLLAMKWWNRTPWS